MRFCMSANADATSASPYDPTTMNNLIRVSGVLACAGALIASAGSSQNRGAIREGCTTDDGRSGFVNGAGYCQGPAAEEYRIEALKREQAVREDRAVEGVTVQAKPFGAGAWTIQISNTSEGSAAVLWDESSFVTSDGRAAGRLIRGETRKIDTGKAQPAEPVPPGAAAIATVFAEKLIGWEETEEKLMERNLRIGPINEAREWRKKNNALIVGGKLHLTLDVGGAKKTWIGAVEAK